MIDDSGQRIAATDAAQAALEGDIDTAVRALADDAGITTTWQDYRGEMHTVGTPTLRVLLGALGLPSTTVDDIVASRARLAAESQGEAGDALLPLVTGTVNGPIALPFGARFAGLAYRVVLEDGAVVAGRFAEQGPAVVDAIHRFGYHRLEVDGASVVLAVAPTRCFGVSDAVTDAGRDGDARVWGLAAQVYGIAEPGDGGLGHYGALKTLVRRAARHGAAALAISPVHAMFSADLHRFSPYGPSSRLLSNALHVDPAAVLGPDALAEVVAECGASDALAELETRTLVDWPASSAWRMALLRRLFDRLMRLDAEPGPTLRAAFDAFRAAGGDVLESHARFEALHAALSADDPAMLGGWRQWPAPFHDPHGPEVAAFAAEHRDDIAFHAFLQWQAATQLAAAQGAARDAGMPIGIVADLAVGADGGGSQAWSRQHDMLMNVSIGAPPDLLNGVGQSWGLAAFSPRALRATGFRPWIDMLRAAFAHAGGIRIDHVLGLTRMWLVPDGAPAVDGAYLRYPFDDLLRLVALESWRHRAIVIGEDLGTVPEGLPERLSAAGLLGIRVLWFERRWHDDGQPFRAPHDWSGTAQAVTTTHDLPTTAGWWCGRDIDWRAKLDLFGEHADEATERSRREADRTTLWRAMTEAGVASGDRPPADAPPLAEALRYIGATPAPLAVAPLEDVLGLVEQPNLPGTIDSHPNWRMRMPMPVDALLESDAVATRLAALAASRP